MITEYSMSDMKLAYIAGFIDGEGCIRIAGNRLRSSLMIAVVNVDKVPLQFILDVFGGTIYFSPRTAPQTSVYTWYLGATPAAKALERLLPYLIVKKKHAILAIQSIGTSPDVRWYLKEEISKLNKNTGRKKRKEIK